MAPDPNWPAPAPSTRVVELGEPSLIEDTEPNPRPAPGQQWVVAVTETVERPTWWRVLAAAVTDEKIMYPGAIGWTAGIVAAAIWDESWPRILLTGAVVALSGAIYGVPYGPGGAPAGTGAPLMGTGASGGDGQREGERRAVVGNTAASSADGRHAGARGLVQALRRRSDRRQLGRSVGARVEGARGVPPARRAVMMEDQRIAEREADMPMTDRITTEANSMTEALRDGTWEWCGDESGFTAFTPFATKAEEDAEAEQSLDTYVSDWVAEDPSVDAFRLAWYDREGELVQALTVWERDQR